MRRKTIWAWVFLAPPLLAYGAVVLVPAVTSFYQSFTNASTLGGASQATGTSNYERLFIDPAFWNALRVTGMWTLVAVTVPIALALVTRPCAERAHPLCAHDQVAVLPPARPVAGCCGSGLDLDSQAG